MALCCMPVAADVVYSAGLNNMGVLRTKNTLLVDIVFFFCILPVFSTVGVEGHTIWLSSGVYEASGIAHCHTMGRPLIVSGHWNKRCGGGQALCDMAGAYS